MPGASVASDLPPEILDNIFEYVGSSYLRSLRRPTGIRACSLVCSTWRHAAHRKLFSELVVNSHQRPSQEFYSTVANNEKHAHIAIYIRSLVINVHARDLVLDFRPNWVDFLRRLTGLQSVAFNYGDTLDLLHPRLFDAEYRDAFFLVLRSPLLTHLEVNQSGGFPLPLIPCCPNLESLILRGHRDKMKYDPTSDPRPDLQQNWSTTPIRLRKLVVTGLSEIHRRVKGFLAEEPQRTIISTASLASLELGFSGTVRSDGADMLALCSSIEELILDFSKAGYGQDWNTNSQKGTHLKDAASLRNLRRLEVRCCQECGIDAFFSITLHIVLDWVLPLLVRLPQPGALESVMVLMENDLWAPSWSDGPVEHLPVLADSAKLWNLLQDANFPRLRSVFVRYPWTPRGKDQFPAP